MATDKSQNKSPVFKVGQLWHTIQDNLSAQQEEAEEDDEPKEDNNETMKLRREDMTLFGLCPAWDQFYLVVCEHCKQVIKPQALKQHIDLRHSYHNHISNSTNCVLKSRINDTSITENGNDSNGKVDNKLISSSTMSSNNNDNINNNNCDTTISVTCIDEVDNTIDNIIDNTIEHNDIKSALKRSPYDSVLLSNSTNSTNSPSLPSLPSLPEPTGPGPGTESSALGVVFNNLTAVTDNGEYVTESVIIKPIVKKKKRASSRKLLPCKDREYDANKHCGVHLQEMDKPCTRSLTCKTHSLTLRRAVEGRVKNFDELLAEHREAKEAALRAQGIEVKPTKKALMKQQKQQQILLNQHKFEPNHQLISDYNRQQTNSAVQVSQTFDSSAKSHVIPSNLLTFATPPPIVAGVNRSSLQSHHQYHQLESGLYMSSHPQPAAVCTFNVRSVPQCSRLLNRNMDLTIASLHSTFSNVSTSNIVSKSLNNSNLCYSSKLSPHSIRSPLRSMSQTCSPTKKLCINSINSMNSINSSSIDYQNSPQSDPYNFPDATTSVTPMTTSYTYIKPKTTIAKSASNPSSNKKKKKNDVNLSLDHSSLLSNGQLFHLSVNKSLANSTLSKKSISKKPNNSHTNSISINSTIPYNNNNNKNNNSNLHDSSTFRTTLWLASTGILE